MPSPTSSTIDWATFIGRHDMQWAQMPLCRPESPETMMRGAFLGNGTLGALVYASDEPCDFPHHALRLDIGRADVADKGGKRTDGGKWRDKWNCGNKGTRLHTGGFVLLSHGIAKAQPMTLDLYQAECRTAVATRHETAGGISMRVLVAATRQVIVAECLLSGTEVIPSHLNNAGDDPMRTAGLDYSKTCRPRFVRRAMSFPGWPPARNSVTDDGILVEVQPLLDGQEYAVAWTEVLNDDRLHLYCSLGVSPGIKSLSIGSDDARSAAEEAIEAVRLARRAGLPAIESEHRAWWSGQWQQSAIAIPDARLESFYQIQIYKFLSSTRAGAPIPDATGPWSYAMGGPDDWAHCPGYPHIWLNFNVQMHCLIGNASGHAGQLATLAERVLAWARRRPDWQADPTLPLAIGGSGGYDLEEGDRQDGCSIHLIWLLHNCWLAARHDGSQEWATRWNELLPVLAAAANEPLARLQSGPDGKLHLLDSHSPEYPALPPRYPVDGRQGMTDAIYELAFTRWALERLCADLPTDPRAGQWRSALQEMTDYPVDTFGLRISAECPHDVGHRHYSHLVMLWPLRLWNWDDASRQELIARSIGTWLGCPPDRKKRTGFTWAAAANICAHIGRGDWAWGHMDTYFEESPRGTARRFSNTMVREWGFILETALGIGNAVPEMLLQSHGGRIRIFPAIPEAWSDAAFHRLSAEGGWKVSAERKNQATTWIRIEATVPGSIRLRHGLAAPLIESTGVTVTSEDDGDLQLTAAAGASILLRSSETINPAFTSVAHRFHSNWRWGG